MNMSYCRFENTYKDLLDCQNALDDYINNDYDNIGSESERRYAKQLIELAREISENFDESDVDRAWEQYRREEEKE